jgi:hypothetical protein
VARVCESYRGLAQDGWNQRYFRVTSLPEPHLAYYKSDKLFLAGKPPLGDMRLENAVATYERDPDHKQQYILHIICADRHMKMRLSAAMGARRHDPPCNCTV